MGRVVVFLLVVVLAAVQAAASGASDPPVPLKVQRAIEAEHSRIAAFPSRVPSGYRYAGWNEYPLGGYLVAFDKRGAYGRVISELSFVVTGQPCTTPALTHAMAIFHINGRTIKAVWTHSDSSALLCLESRRGRRLLVAGANGTPRTDALLVAYAQPAD